MDCFRKLVGILFAFWCVAFAAPVLGGPTKIYSLDMVVGTLDTTTGRTTVTALLKNQSPPSVGSSNISSFTLTLTSGVGAQIVGFAQPASGNVTFNGTSVTVTNMSPLKGQQTFMLDVYVVGCGDGSSWNPTVYTGSSLTGSTFSQDPRNPSHLGTNLKCGNVTCSDQFTVTRPFSSLPVDTITGARGPFNSDGSCNLTVPYFLSNLLLNNNTMHFRWPAGTDTSTNEPDAVFLYTVNGPSTNPKLGWLNTDGSSASDSVGGSPVFLEVLTYNLFCKGPNTVGDYYPRPYGQLAQAISETDTRIRVDMTNTEVVLLSVGTDIVIGNERMTVTKINTSTNTWTVTRGVGLTTPAPHSALAAIMFTPLPLLPTNIALPTPYTPGKQAQMCEIGPNNVSGPNTFIDIGDGWYSVGGGN